MKNTQNSQSLLLIGGPAVGKTHYGGQLLGRLQDGRSHLKLRGTPTNIVPFEDALTRLGQGLTASHTPTHVYNEVIIPIDSPATGQLDLIWPDYGGEQIKQLVEQRQISQEWRRRIDHCTSWLLFIRLDQVTSFDNIISRPSVPSDGEHVPYTATEWSSQAHLVELLQYLLHAKGVDTLCRVAKPTLTIVLSCWDELESTEQMRIPSELLNHRLPLFSSFIRTTWLSERMAVFGLSSLGKALNNRDADEDYCNQGPENFGYIVLPSGERSPDLTIPITMMIERYK